MGSLTWANDTFVHESAGNLMFVQNNEVAIAKERLVIGPAKRGGPGALGWTIPIHVEYELKSLSAKTVKAGIGFPLAPCVLTNYLAEKTTNFVSGSAATCVKEPRMTLKAGGRTIVGKWGFVFLRDGAPLGTSPAEVGLSKRLGALIDLVGDPDKKYFVEDPVFLKAATELCGEFRGEMKGPECQAFDRILVHRTYLWDYTFPAGSTVQVVHDYSVNASWNLHPETVFPFDAFCLSDPVMRTTWKNYREENARQVTAAINGVYKGVDEYPYPQEFFTEYVLRTGALWAGPIKDFELVIRKSSPKELISTCFSGLTKSSAVEFKVHKTNFKPEEDLRVLFLRPAGK